MHAEADEIIFKVIRERRSVRSYDGRQVSKKMLERLMEAGQWAPSPSNVQSWRFVAVQEGGQLAMLKSLSPGFPRQATAAIAICSDQREAGSFSGESKTILLAEEAAMAGQNMLLMAHAMGLGACAVASFSEAGIRTLLELPDPIRPILIVALGFPEELPIAPKRKALSQITSWETYQEG